MSQHITDANSYWVRRTLPMSPQCQKLTAPDGYSASPLLLAPPHIPTGAAMIKLPTMENDHMCRLLRTDWVYDCVMA